MKHFKWVDNVVVKMFGFVKPYGVLLELSTKAHPCF